MPNASAPHGARRSVPAGPSGDDDWGATTSIRSSSAGTPTRSASGRANPSDWRDLEPRDGDAASRRPSGVSPRDPAAPSRRDPAAPSRRDVGTPSRHEASSAAAAARRREDAAPARRERGLPGWGAVLLLLALAAVGGLIDVIAGSQVRGAFNIGIVVASVVAILAVRRSSMFPVVVAPPIVYSVGSAGTLYIRSSGGHDKRALFDAAANWLVYGFPAIASATAAVLIIAGIRLMTRR